MSSEAKHTPLILLYDDDYAKPGFVKAWFEESRFQTCEALNAFDALETVADFTVRTRPDVLLLHCDSAVDDVEFIRDIMASVPGACDMPIFALSGSDRENNVERDLAGIVERLERLVPRASARTN